MLKRDHAVTRIEGFSDAVFGFALTLLVVQLEVPKTSDALLDLVRGSVPFAVTFALVCYLWWEHNKFFRRYGLQNAWVAFLNSVLLFVVLFYVYPLKFMATALLGPLVGMADVRMGNGRVAMLIYSAGVLSIFSTFVLLYQHAWSRREVLGLDAPERLMLRSSLRAHVMSASLGLASIVLTLVLPGQWLAVAGLLYGLMGPLHAWNGARLHKAMKKLDKGE